MSSSPMSRFLILSSFVTTCARESLIPHPTIRATVDASGGIDVRQADVTSKPRSPSIARSAVAVEAGGEIEILARLSSRDPDYKSPMCTSPNSTTSIADSRGMSMLSRTTSFAVYGADTGREMNFIVWDCHRHKRLEFLHIPKNGGTAIEDAGLASNVQWGRFRMPGSTEMPDGNVCSNWHVPPAYLQHPNPYDDEDAEVFCVTRDPWERIISEYVWELNVKFIKRARTWERCTREDLNAFVLGAAEKALEGKRFLNDCHLLPQWDYIQDDSGRVWCEHTMPIEQLTDTFNAVMIEHQSTVRLKPRPQNYITRCPNLESQSRSELFDVASQTALRTLWLQDFLHLGDSLSGEGPKVKRVLHAEIGQQSRKTPTSGDNNNHSDATLQAHADASGHKPTIWEAIKFSEKRVTDRQLNSNLTTRSIFQIAANEGRFDMTNPNVRECLGQYESLDNETLSLLDSPHLSCMTSTLVPDGPSMEKLSASMAVIGKDAQLLSNFPSTTCNVAVDPISKRQHIFVVGPESSGTHFMQRVLASCYADGPVGPPEFFGNDNVQIPHISQPEGSMCSEHSEPVLQSFPAHPQMARHVLTQTIRFFVNPVTTIADYKKRGEKIQFVQMVRSPQLSFFSKMHGHCSNKALGLAEHKLAFKLMMDAIKEPEVTTFCYEEVMEKGPDFLRQELQRMGIDTTKLIIPAFRDGNHKYSANNHVDCDSVGIHELNHAYVKLCPNSPHTKDLERECGF